MNILLKLFGKVTPKLSERAISLQYAKDNVSAGTCFYSIQDSEANNAGFEGYGEKTYDYIVLDTNDKGIMIQAFYFLDNKLMCLTPSFYDWELTAHMIKGKSKMFQRTPDYLKDIPLPEGMK